MNKSWAAFVGLGFELTGLILGGYWIGGIIGVRFQAAELGEGLGAFLGLGLWIFHMVQFATKINRNEDAETQLIEKGNSIRSEKEKREPGQKR